MSEGIIDAWKGTILTLGYRRLVDVDDKRFDGIEVLLHGFLCVQCNVAKLSGFILYTISITLKVACENDMNTLTLRSIATYKHYTLTFVHCVHVSLLYNNCWCI